MIKIYLGFSFSHDIYSTCRIEWRVLNVPIVDTPWPEVADQINRYAKNAAKIKDAFSRTGALPCKFSQDYPLHVPSECPPSIPGAGTSPVKATASKRFRSRVTKGTKVKSHAKVQSCRPQTTSGGPTQDIQRILHVTPSRVDFKATYHLIIPSNKKTIHTTSVVITNRSTRSIQLWIDRPSESSAFQWILLRPIEEISSTSVTKDTDAFTLLPNGVSTITVEFQIKSSFSCDSNSNSNSREDDDGKDLPQEKQEFHQHETMIIRYTPVRQSEKRIIEIPLHATISTSRP